ncbi:MAG: replication-associated recombination protein A [Coriobacteriia bacterium]|nr:replication-associated recombination protein A [Coriobacteriia bacterium]MBN2823549.1 replication-associated recombination protein A [Coriobacteriia bacterium]
MDDLFSEFTERTLLEGAPLAARMRPRTLDEFIGQQDVIGPGTVLRTAIENDALSSLILYGPAGCGKTSLAKIIAGVTRSHFVELSAVSSGVKDVRAAINGARERLSFSAQQTIVFIDEIHRFNRSQQDALLHAVEERLIVLVGATTENPFFEVNAPLISRSRVLELHPLSDDDIRLIVRSALRDGERGLGDAFVLDDDAMERIVITAGGDARSALTTLELSASISRTADEGVSRITVDAVAEATRTRALTYDKTGDAHYDVVSAFIKSMRGSDPDATVYWLARMVHGGEDPKFIARRMLVFASEDVGLADPNALPVAHAAVKAAEFIGWPECRINLAHAAIYLALAPKSNAAYRAINSALAEVRDGASRSVPDHLRDRHRPGADSYPAYRYPHDYPDARVEQQYLPDGLQGRRFFTPSAREEDE